MHWGPAAVFMTTTRHFACIYFALGLGVVYIAIWALKTAAVYVVISALGPTGYGIWLYQFLIIAYLFTLFVAILALKSAAGYMHWGAGSRVYNHYQ